MLQIVICEDNEHYLSHLTYTVKNLLIKNNMKGEIICSTTKAADVENTLTEGNGNVFFLDINLTDTNTGFLLAERIRKTNINAYIIFITGHFEFVLQAFKVHSFDFLVKPVTDEVLEQCLQRIYKHHITITNNYKYIEIRSGSSIYKIKTDDIVYVERLKRDTIIYTKNGQITSHESLESLEKTLNSENFIRCHKSFIANKLFISQILLREKIIVFETGQQCSFGRKYRNEVSALKP
ncbi:MAG: LytR/AlgR family response regulator transcription factor [Bacillota bacterium]